MNIRMRTALAMVAVPALALVGCGGSSNPTTTAAATGSSSSQACVKGQEPDINCDGKVVIGILSPGDTHDHGYYESFVDAADKYAQDNGWKIITVDKVNPADAVTQARNLCRQNIDMMAIAASELKDAIPVAAEPDCKDPIWYVAGGQGVVQTPYFVQSQDDVNESLYVAGVAAALLMKDANSTKAGYITGPEYDFAKQAAKAFKVGIQSQIPNATLLTAYTGDFNDSAKAKEAAQAQLSQGVGVIYPYLGGATDAVAQLANQKNVPVLTPGTDQCSRTDVKFQISVVFSPGDYFAAALHDFKAGTLKEGSARVWHMGKDPVPTVKICKPKAGEQEKVDQVMQQIGSGALNVDDVVKNAK